MEKKKIPSWVCRAFNDGKCPQKDNRHTSNPNFYLKHVCNRCTCRRRTNTAWKPTGGLSASEILGKFSRFPKVLPIQHNANLKFPPKNFEIMIKKKIAYP